jgi:hypothetical protein
MGSASAKAEAMSRNGTEAEREDASTIAEHQSDDEVIDSEPKGAISPDEPFYRNTQMLHLPRVHPDQRQNLCLHEDGQTYIADPDAGTYRELVVAAENCQVTIIHPPGKARNPYEPGFQDFIERAEAFQ